MAVPDFQSIMLPLLEFCADNKEHTARELIDAMAKRFNLTDEEKKELLPGGTQGKFSNRVSWTKAHLKMAGLVEMPKRGVCKITEKGMQVLQSNPGKINLHFLSQLPEYAEYRKTHDKQAAGEEGKDEDSQLDLMTPREILDSADKRMRDELVAELLKTIKTCSPSFFEKLVVDVIVKMGYGGPRQDAGYVTGKTGDGGIDGFINEDKLGLDVIYIQAKRWDSIVGRPEIQKFVGALAGKKAKKGLFISTSSYSTEAVAYAEQLDLKVVLIGGETLAQYMIDHNVGVSTIGVYYLKKIDFDYFEDE